MSEGTIHGIYAGLSESLLRGYSLRVRAIFRNDFKVICPVQPAAKK